MKAVVITPEKTLELRELPAPDAKAGYVVIDVYAAGVNRADLLQVDGNYPPPEGWPDWPGLECAGVVYSASGSSRFRPGDRVCALLGGGGYAEQVAVPEELVMPMPENCSFVQAAALPEVFATAMVIRRSDTGVFFMASRALMRMLRSVCWICMESALIRKDACCGTAEVSS